jgi:CRISPR-associated exonuclease Cas4
MYMLDQDEFLPLSALQQFVYCPRQCALIHIEREWDESVLTARGRVEHAHTDEGYREFRRGKRQISGLHVRSESLGIQGQLDVLELELDDSAGPDNLPSFGIKGTWRIYPVEFKHGQPKQSDCDRIQLCAQAMCLEEMIGVRIDEAALFYRRTRRREDVVIDASLRKKTEEAAKLLHSLFRSGSTPSPVNDARCRACSLKMICMPKKMIGQNRYKQKLFTPQEIE